MRSRSSITAAVLALAAVLFVSPPAASASVTSVTADDLGASWRPGCPVTPDQLRRVDIDYIGFDGQAHTGQLIVHQDVVTEVVAIFARLRAQRFPIERMQNVTAYAGADDELSMRDNNTSAFNCRGIPGSTSWSWHAYGKAVDVNPKINPFVPRGEPAQPANAGQYVDRSRPIPGMFIAGDDAVRAFTDEGWTWGGGWTDPIDYQHFERP